MLAGAGGFAREAGALEGEERKAQEPGWLPRLLILHVTVSPDTDGLAHIMYLRLTT